MMQRKIRPARRRVAAVVLVCLGFAQPAPAAMLFPLVSESASPLPHGEMEAFAGVAYKRNDRFPPFTPKGVLESHDLVAAPRFGMRIGAGGWAEIQASYELLLIDEELTGGRKDTHYGSGDARLFTKVQLFEECGWRPDFGLRFGTKLPNANRENRLGTDDTDFFLETLTTHQFGSVHLHANLGIALLGNPGPAAEGGSTYDAGGQDDLFTWNLAAEAEPLTALALRPLVELSGLVGSRFDNDRTAAQFGVQHAFGAVDLFAGVSVGLAGASEDFGLATGVVYRFRPARWLGEAAAER